MTGSAVTPPNGLNVSEKMLCLYYSAKMSLFIYLKLKAVPFCLPRQFWSLFILSTPSRLSLMTRIQLTALEMLLSGNFHFQILAAFPFQFRWGAKEASLASLRNPICIRLRRRPTPSSGQWNKDFHSNPCNAKSPTPKREQSIKPPGNISPITNPHRYWTEAKV